MRLPPNLLREFPLFAFCPSARLGGVGCGPKVATLAEAGRLVGSHAHSPRSLRPREMGSFRQVAFRRFSEVRSQFADLCFVAKRSALRSGITMCSTPAVCWQTAKGFYETPGLHIYAPSVGYRRGGSNADSGLAPRRRGEIVALLNSSEET